LCFQVGASSGWSIFRLEHYQVRALSDAIFSSFAKNGLCLSQVIAFSGYCIFRLERFLVMPFSGSEKNQGYCIFRYAIFSQPIEMTHGKQLWVGKSSLAETF
jgi:hypothetical protein